MRAKPKSTITSQTQKSKAVNLCVKCVGDCPCYRLSIAEQIDSILALLVHYLIATKVLLLLLNSLKLSSIDPNTYS